MACVMLAGCGTTSGSLNATAARQLRGQIASVAADAGHQAWNSALAGLRTLDHSVSEQRAQGRLDAAQTQALLTGIGQAEAQIQAHQATTQAPRSTTPAAAAAQPPQPAVPPAAAPADARHGKGKGKGNGKDKGKGNGPGGDGGGGGGD